MVFLALCPTVLQHWVLNDYVISPGQAQAVAPLIKISGIEHSVATPDILLTDVYIQQVTAWGWLAAHLHSDEEIVSGSDLADPGVPLSELEAQGYLQMSDAKTAATAAALSALGWQLPIQFHGATVAGVVSHSPAMRAGIHVADRIVSIKGIPVRSACDLVRALKNIAPLSRVLVGFSPATISSSGTITNGTVRVVTATTARVPAGLGPSSCPGVVTPQSWLGIETENAISFLTPGTISVATPNIGGPSAGLAMTLGIIDSLTAGRLTNGRVIAATGTMAADGHVGDVGGVAQKTVAVERAGATIFMVPQVEYATALSASNGHLRIIGVTTLAQALRALRGNSDPLIPMTKPSVVK